MKSMGCSVDGKNIIYRGLIDITSGNDCVFLMQDLKYRRVELFENIEWMRFRDGWPNIFINNVQAIAGRDGQ